TSTGSSGSGESGDSRAMLKIILADNQAIFRAGAAKVLAVEDDLRIVAQAQTPEQMHMALDRFRAAVLVFSPALAPDFAELITTARQQSTRLVLVAENGEDPGRYLKAGVGGVVFRSITGSALVECVRQVAKGESYVQDIHSLSDISESDQVGARVRDR